MKKCVPIVSVTWLHSRRIRIEIEKTLILFKQWFH